LNFEIVLFDLGNTLLYFDAEWPQVMHERNQVLLHSLQEAGIPLPEQPFLSRVDEKLDYYYSRRETEFIEYTTDFIVKEVLAELGYPNIAADVLSQALRTMHTVSQSHWVREQDTLPTLERLRQMGCRMGLVSNAGDDADVQTLVDGAQIRPYFDVILTSASQGVRKPNPRIFLNALKTWDASPSQAVMVGDTLGADILGAMNAGIYSIWITRRSSKPGNQDHLDTIQPDAVIENLSELPGLLKHKLSRIKPSG